jgi:hypothetical protein
MPLVDPVAAPVGEVVDELGTYNGSNGSEAQPGAGDRRA